MCLHPPFFSPCDCNKISTRILCVNLYVLESTLTFGYTFCTMHKCTHPTHMHIFSPYHRSMHSIGFHLHTSAHFLNSFSHIPRIAVHVMASRWVCQWCRHTSICVELLLLLLLLLAALLAFSGHHFLFLYHAVLCKIFITSMFIPHHLTPQIDLISLLWQLYQCKNIVARNTIHLHPVYAMYNVDYTEASTDAKRI